MVVLTDKQKIEKAAQTTRAAFQTLAEERRHSDAKTSRLRALRLEKEAQTAAEPSPASKPKARRKAG